MPLDQSTASKIGAEIASNVSSIDEYFRQIEQTDPPLDANYQANLPSVINTCYQNIAKLAQYCLDQNGIPVPDKISTQELQSAGIVPTVEESPPVQLSGNTLSSKAQTIS